MTTFDPSFFLAQLIHGIVIGSLYALMGLGLTLIFGIMRVVNFAHGEFYTLGGYLTYFTCIMFGLNPIIGLLVAMVVTFFIGLLVQRFLVRPVLKAGELYSLLITFFLSVTLQYLMLILWGPFYKRPPPIFGFNVSVAGLEYSADRLLFLSLSVILISALMIFIRKTWMGKAIRATAQDAVIASMMGVKISTIHMVTFGIGAALAASSGSLLGQIYMIEPLAGFLPVVKSFVIIVLGGLGSVKGAIYGGVTMGVVEALGSAYINPAYREIFGFILLMGTLLIRPSGLFGEKE